MWLRIWSRRISGGVSQFDIMLRVKTVVSAYALSVSMLKIAQNKRSHKSDRDRVGGSYSNGSRMDSIHLRRSSKHKAVFGRTTIAIEMLGLS